MSTNIFQNQRCKETIEGRKGLERTRLAPVVTSPIIRTTTFRGWKVAKWGSIAGQTERFSNDALLTSAYILFARAISEFQYSTPIIR